MSFLREPGDLSRTPLAAILLEAWNLRATGALTVKHPGGDLGGDQSPAFSNILINLQPAAGKPQLEIAVQPVFQTQPPATIRQSSHALSQFPERQDTEIQVFFLLTLNPFDHGR